MRVPRVRMTVRTLMIAVALLSLTVYGSILAMRMGPQAQVYQSHAQRWRAEEGAQRKQIALCRKEIEGTDREASGLRAKRHIIGQADELARQITSEARWWRANAAHAEEMLAYCSMMRRKYEHAARSPWLVVALIPGALLVGESRPDRATPLRPDHANSPRAVHSPSDDGRRGSGCRPLLGRPLGHPDA